MDGHSTPRIEILPFSRLDIGQLYDVLLIRHHVFVIEQKITSEPDIDGADRVCHHAIASIEGEAVATARIFADHDPIVVGRVSVLPRWQGRGVGTVLMRQIQEFIGQRSAQLHAQAHLEPWYTRLGWERVGERYMEAGIEHVTMHDAWGPKMQKRSHDDL